jgi:hypothetical protein
MSKSRNKPATPPPPAAPPLVADKHTVARAILELHINVPVYSALVVGDRIELRLYGGKVAYWPPAETLGPPGPAADAGDGPKEEE